jgi:hypothetical protein
MWLNRLDDRPQGNSQTIAPDSFLSGDRSSCDGTFFLKVNRCKLSLCANAQKPPYQVDSFRIYVGYATAFVKHAGWEPVGLRMIRLQRCQRTGISAVHISPLSPYIFPICAASLTCMKSSKSVLGLAGIKSNRCFAIDHLSPTGSWSPSSCARRGLNLAANLALPNVSDTISASR